MFNRLSSPKAAFWLGGVVLIGSMFAVPSSSFAQG